MMIDRRAVRRALEPLHASENTIEEVLNMARQETNRKRRYPARRLLAVAAVIALMLAICGVGYAVYQFTLADRVVAEWVDGSDGTRYIQYSPVGYQDEAVELTAENSPEAMAMAEWKEYEQEQIERMVQGEEDWGEMVPYDDPIRSTYGNAWSNDVEKIREIAEKYGLRLYESVAYTGSLDEFYRLTGLEAFAPLSEGSAETSSCNASVYDDGSFEIRAVRLPLSAETEDKVSVSVLRAMKGTFCDFLILGDEAEIYQNETYTTKSGHSVELALGETSSMIFTELDGCYVTVDVCGGTDPGRYRTLLDMDDLKYMADSLEYSRLGGIDDALVERVMEEEKKDEAYMAEKQAEREAEEAAYYVSVSEIIGELGRFEITELPEGYVVDEMVNGAFAAEVQNPWRSDSGEVFAQAYLFFTYNDATMELSYERWWEDENKNASVTDELYNDYKAYSLETSPARYTAGLTVNGGDAFARVDDIYIELVWMDAENDLCFSLLCRNNGEYTLDDLIAMAESVTEA